MSSGETDCSELPIEVIHYTGDAPVPDGNLEMWEMWEMWKRRRQSPLTVRDLEELPRDQSNETASPCLYDAL